jgi:hypothetical protein
MNHALFKNYANGERINEKKIFCLKQQFLQRFGIN